MLPFIHKHFLSKSKVLPICIWLPILSLFFYFSSAKVSLAKNEDTQEMAYYYFLLSQILSENLKEAENYIKKAIDYDKRSLFLKKMLLSIYLQMADLKAAEKLGETLYQKFPYDREVVYYISKLYLLQNRPQRAISTLEKYLEHNPKDTEMLSFLISIYLQQKDWDQALLKLEQMEKIHPQASAIWVFKARIYREKKDFLTAKKAYLKAIELSPDDRAILVETLKFLESFGDYSEIENILQNYLLKNPEDKDFMRLLLGFYLEQKQWDKSEQLLEQYLRQQKNQPELLFYLGLTLEYKGKEEEALKIYNEIPLDSPWALEGTKRTFGILKKRNLKEAENYLNTIKEKFPKDKSYYLFLAHAYEDLDLCEEGINTVQEGLKKFPDDPDLILSLASNYACLENYEKVLALVEPLQKKFPDDAYILNFVGYSLVELERNLELAEDLLLKAISLKPKDPYIEDSLGWLYFKKANIEKALYYLEKAVQNLNNDEPVIWEHLGEVYLKIGKHKEACELFKKAFEKTLHKREKIRLEEKLKKCP